MVSKIDQWLSWRWVQLVLAIIVFIVFVLSRNLSGLFVSGAYILFIIIKIIGQSSSTKEK